MDFGHAVTIFTTLYQDVKGYTLSAQGKKTLGSFDKAFTYGEVTPKAFYEIIKQVESKDKIFYDLGSGTGKAVILAALLFDFKKCVGIELIDELWSASEGIRERYEQEMLSTFPDKKEKTHFLKGNFLTMNLMEADVVFAHSTCFGEELMKRLAEKLESQKKEGIVITITKILESPVHKLIKTFEVQMGWGRGTVYIYKKI